MSDKKLSAEGFKTPYLIDLIEDYKALDKKDVLGSMGKEQLKEYQSIKEALKRLERLERDYEALKTSDSIKGQNAQMWKEKFEETEAENESLKSIGQKIVEEYYARDSAKLFNKIELLEKELLKTKG